jgi:hypothetical protein
MRRPRLAWVRMRLQASVRPTLAAASAGLAVILACAPSEEPRAPPIVARRLGGDSVVPGPMVVRCRPDDEACIPAYAVACPAPAGSDSGTAAQRGPPLSPQEQAFCMKAAPDSGAGKKQ